MMIKRRFAMIGTYFLACVLTTVHAQTTSKEPRAILLQTLATYETATSYEDKGLLRLMPLKSRRSDSASLLSIVSGKTSVSFKTYFTRPEMFRFEWYKVRETQNRPSVIWFDGTRGFSWTPNPALKRERFLLRGDDNVGSLIEDSLKPSGGMVFTVPSLLMTHVAPYTFGDVVKDLTDVSLTKPELVDGELCFVIVGKAKATPWVFWIGSKTHLLRKARSFYSIGTFHDPKNNRRFIAEEIHQEIKLNEGISASVFRYRPRLRSGDFDMTK